MALAPKQIIELTANPNPLDGTERIEIQLVAGGPGSSLKDTIGNIADLANDSLTTLQVETALGFTPLNQAAASFGGSAAKLTTPRNIAITGDLAWNVNFDGSGNVTAAGALAATAVVAGTYGDATHVGQFTVDAKGRITGASNVPITGGAASGPITTSGLTIATASLAGRTTAATGAIEEISAGTGLSLAAGSLSLANTAVAAGAYGDATHVATFTVDAQGRLTAAAAVAIAGFATTGLITGSGLTINTASLAGRTTAAAGAIEEISIGAGLSLAAGSLAAATNVSSAASSASPFAWNSNATQQFCFTALANALTINADSGAPADGQKVTFRFKDDGTGRVLTWTTGSAKSFRAVGITLPATTVANKVLYVGCIYNADASRWDAIATAQEA